MKAIAVLALLAGPFFCAPAAEASLAITEIMANPNAAPDAQAEWFEIFNNGPTSVNLKGYSFIDNGPTGFTVDRDLVIGSGGYLVFCNNGDYGSNGGVVVDYVYQYSSFRLANSGDEITVKDDTGVLLDFVNYNDPGMDLNVRSGVSFVLSGVDTTVHNNDANNWAYSTTSYGAGDLGSPGSGSYTLAVPEASAFLSWGLLVIVYSAAHSCILGRREASMPNEFNARSR